VTVGTGGQKQSWWSGAVTELACFSLARMKGKDLIEIIDTKRGLLRYVCIFRDKKQ